jgi:hypothetical protein
MSSYLIDLGSPPERWYMAIRILACRSESRAEADEFLAAVLA